MFKALWVLTKIILLTAVAVWVADIPGEVQLSWNIYDITIQLGPFLVILLAALVMSMLIFRGVQALFSIPSLMRAQADRGRLKKGMRALTLGLTAVAAGDKKIAYYQAYRAEKLLPRDYALPLLLKAQAALMKGRKEEADDAFTALLDHKDAAFLGVRGLIQSAVDDENYEFALEVGRQALSLYPRQAWILKSVYDLELRARDWQQARRTLDRVSGSDLMPKDAARDERVAIHIAWAQDERKEGRGALSLARLKEAHKLNPQHLPAALYLARAYVAEGKRKNAASVVEKIWRKNPHQDLVPLWMEAMPQTKKNPDAAKIEWLKKLNRMNAANNYGHLALARAYMQSEFWGEARQEAELAQEHGENAALYALLVDLEEKTSGDVMRIDDLKSKAIGAPQAACWICRDTGRVYQDWQPIAEPHGSFNSIVWDYPQNITGHKAKPANDMWDAPIQFIEGA